MSQAQLDKVKRKALLGPDTTTRVVTSAANPPTRTPLNNTSVQRQPLGDVGAVMGGMQASGVIFLVVLRTKLTPLPRSSVPHLTTALCRWSLGDSQLTHGQVAGLAHPR